MRAFLQHIHARLIYLPRTISLIWRAASAWMSAWVVLLVIQGVLPVATIALTRPLVDNLALVVGDGPQAGNPSLVLWIGSSIGLIMLIGLIVDRFSGWVRSIQAEQVRDYISDLVHEQSAAVDLAFYDSADYFDNLHRARDEAADRPIELLESLGELIQNGVTMAGVAVVLFAYGVWVPLALAVSILPALLVVVRSQREYYRWWLSTTPERRWADYYSLVLTDAQAAPEVRLFDLGGSFREAFNHRRRALRHQYMRLTHSQLLNQLLSALLALIITGLAVGWMIWRALLGAVSLGDVILFYQAFDRGQALLRGLLSNLGQIYGTSLFLSSLFEFLDLRPAVQDAPSALPSLPEPRAEIRFHNVTFSYPGGDRVALERFNLTIPAGKIVAVVGANGAGKSTLIKLLCRFYDCEAGRIEIDGVDIRRYRLASLRRQITVLFQHPMAYHATASENISIGDQGRAHPATAIEQAARGAGAHEVITSLPQGYDTLLGKYFASGTDLSGGEWQRVALARAFLRQSPILLLDEPTSFMDSWGENEWLGRFRTLMAGRTALIITHRFTTAIRADIIHVMDHGQIVESGTHAELLSLGGLYAQSWRAQVRDTNREDQLLPAAAD